MVPVGEVARKTLVALASLLTHPIDQGDLQTSLRAAKAAVALVALPGFGQLIRDGVGAGSDRLVTSVVILLVWMVVTSKLARRDRKKLQLARNLGLVSIWIVVTQVLVMAAGVLYADPLARSVRFLIVCGLLMVLVPAHLLRDTDFRTAAKLTLPLWLTMGILAWRIIF